tara:strand:- start:1993 stop:2454 length:462 start_codon:yes stop_codon:yes gene_type:complete
VNITDPTPAINPKIIYRGNLFIANGASSVTDRISSPWIKKYAVKSEASEAKINGTKLAAVKSIIMTSTAKIMAAIGALKMAAREAAEAHPIKSRRLRKFLFVWFAISEPIVAPACTAGASNPPEPPKPTDKTLVTTGANSQVRFNTPLRVESA